MQTFTEARPRTSAHWLSYVALGLLVGCGGESGGSGVDGSKTLDQISDSDAVALCEYSLSRVPDQAILELECISSAIFSTGDQASCSAAYDDCIAEGLDPDEQDDCSMAAEDLSDLPDCGFEITVAQFEACIDGQWSVLQEVLDDATCTSDESVFEPLNRLAPACETIAETCPEFRGPQPSGKSTLDRVRLAETLLEVEQHLFARA